MKVAGIQCDLAWEDPAANRAALLPRIREAARAGARLVALPEMWPTGFSMATDRVVEPVGGPSETFLCEAAAETGITLLGSIATADPAGGLPQNVCVVAGPGGVLGRYAKIHPFGYGGEAARYAGGETLLTLEIEGLRVTPLVCYDLRFPELTALVARKTDLFVFVANWPETRAVHWRTLLRARAMECQCAVLGVNRVGEGAGLRYRGDSVLLSPLGEVLDEAAPGAEATVLGEITAADVARVRAELPFLPDRRPDVYRRLRGEG